MKILTIAVPCYNSMDYMEHCIDTLVTGGEEVEIIIVNDGSQDETPIIAERLRKQYPTIIKVIHQENGGHGDAVNTGLKNATGEYFKVVDSDDWVDKRALKYIIDTLKYMVDENKKLDMLLSNFVYDKQGVKRKKVMSYRNAFPTKRITSWNSKIDIKITQYILMHSVIYRTGLLRDCGLELPKHTFYVDNIYVFKPLPYVKRLCYVDVDFYHYYIGRSDQSVNEKVMISRIDQHIKVAKTMIEDYINMEVKSKYLNKYMLQNLKMMMCIASIMLILSNEKKNYKKKDELWLEIKRMDRKLYKKLRYSILGVAVNIPTSAGRLFAKISYKIAQKIVGFN